MYDSGVFVNSRAGTEPKELYVTRGFNLFYVQAGGFHPLCPKYVKMRKDPMFQALHQARRTYISGYPLSGIVPTQDDTSTLNKPLTDRLADEEADEPESSPAVSMSKSPRLKRRRRFTRKRAKSDAKRRSAASLANPIARSQTGLREAANKLPKRKQMDSLIWVA